MSRTKLSVNINKIATLRNSRGGDVPNVLQVALDCERFGAQGITVHPRPDERHIRYRDVEELRPLLTTEFNIEGYPSPDFIQLVMQVRPAQVTLVPDPPGALTSDAGWDTRAHLEFLTETIASFQREGIRTSLFVDPIEEFIEFAAKAGTDRIELYTGPYAKEFLIDPAKAVEPYVRATNKAKNLGIGVNAGHDLSLINLKFFIEQTIYINEVSIGHALIADALYKGLEQTIIAYRNCLINPQI